jgi:hypothetical protein
MPVSATTISVPRLEELIHLDFASDPSDEDATGMVPKGESSDDAR